MIDLLQPHGAREGVIEFDGGAWPDGTALDDTVEEWLRGEPAAGRISGYVTAQTIGSDDGPPPAQRRGRPTSNKPLDQYLGNVSRASAFNVQLQFFSASSYDRH